MTCLIVVKIRDLSDLDRLRFVKIDPEIDAVDMIPEYRLGIHESFDLTYAVEDRRMMSIENATDQSIRQSESRIAEEPAELTDLDEMMLPGGTEELLCRDIVKTTELLDRGGQSLGRDKSIRYFLDRHSTSLEDLK